MTTLTPPITTKKAYLRSKENYNTVVNSLLAAEDFCNMSRSKRSSTYILIHVVAVFLQYPQFFFESEGLGELLCRHVEHDFGCQ